MTKEMLMSLSDVDLQRADHAYSTIAMLCETALGGPKYAACYPEYLAACRRRHDIRDIYNERIAKDFDHGTDTNESGAN